jgi:hypothetical protein
MVRIATRREKSIRKHFGLASNAEIFFSHKAIPGPNGKKLHGWFCNEGGVTRYLGSSANASVSTKMEAKTVMPPPKFVASC